MGPLTNGKKRVNPGRYLLSTIFKHGLLDIYKQASIEVRAPGCGNNSLTEREWSIDLIYRYSNTGEHYITPSL
jgi:hypothetical protein